MTRSKGIISLKGVTCALPAVINNAVRSQGSPRARTMGISGKKNKGGAEAFVGRRVFSCGARQEVISRQFCRLERDVYERGGKQATCSFTGECSLSFGKRGGSLPLPLE
ncbi:hypothetical protein CEXT_93721 [Caerostris extrusa]|uniref:Uncharacterized protein n=1 Tax=Caerostris extrusa TaxID=172846 RepID=A0AAV4YBT5_CAEEX|nr:hypothetical protein CEXT_93721 [Caerostris extrusa]